MAGQLGDAESAGEGGREVVEEYEKAQSALGWLPPSVGGTLVLGRGSMGGRTWVRAAVRPLCVVVEE